MAEDKDGNQELVYASNKPKVLALRRAFDDTLSDLSGFRNQARVSYDSRRNYWLRRPAICANTAQRRSRGTARLTQSPM